MTITPVAGTDDLNWLDAGGVRQSSIVVITVPASTDSTGIPFTDNPTGVSRFASSGASVNATLVKATPGKVFRITGNNAKASIIYLKLYNKATAPTVGTDAPFVVIPIAASALFDKSLDGLAFTTGIGFGLTTDAADNGTTALLAGDILNFALTYA